VSRRPPPREGFATVILDCDSTLADIEGIDELAPAHREQIAALTAAAMDGSVPLDEVYGRRLDLIRPTQAEVDALAAAYVAALVPHARETVAALRWLGKTVRILSGGLRPPVEAVARELGLSVDVVDAVGISFAADVSYAGFDSASPLTRNGGKEAVLRGIAFPRPALIVGDGMTDAEARPAVDAFAAYTAVVHRPGAVELADWVLSDASLAPVLSLAAGEEDRRRLASSPHAELLQMGDAMLAAGDRPDRAVD
jgi:phosphoserine phosphatase